MLNANKIDFVTSESSGKVNMDDGKEKCQFPTVGLKSLLQNSDLLELLLKPLETNTGKDSKKSLTHETDTNNDSLFDIGILDECLGSKNQ